MRLADCTRLQKRYLHRHVCWLCEQPLDRDWCGAMFERCSQEIMDKRRADCLTHYRPKEQGHG
jgi:hypothetical protein